VAPATTPWILALAQDLFFTVQISGTAKRKGLAVRFCGTPEAALSLLPEAPLLVLVDLNLAGVDTPALIAALRSAAPALPIAAYVSHVQVELRAQAAAAGADPVWARSAFATRFPPWIDALLLRA